MKRMFYKYKTHYCLVAQIMYFTIRVYTYPEIEVNTPLDVQSRLKSSL